MKFAYFQNQKNAYILEVIKLLIPVDSPLLPYNQIETENTYSVISITTKISNFWIVEIPLNNNRYKKYTLKYIIFFPF